jgi:hypothetical protein
MPINWAEVKKAIAKYKRKARKAKKMGYRVVDFIEWAKKNYGKA